MNPLADAFFGIFNMKRVEQPMRLDVTVPLVVTRGQNNREHHMVRAKRVKAERKAVSDKLYAADLEADPAYALFEDALNANPCVGARVTLLRPFARTPLDSDNLSGAFKGVRDEVAAFLGVDDKSERLFFRYVQCKAQRRSEFYEGRKKDPVDCNIRIRIEILPAADVDPLQTAVKVLRDMASRLRARVNCSDEGDLRDIDQALATADALAMFEPKELYDV